MDLNQSKNTTKVGVAIISGSCCFPAVIPFEEKAKKAIEQAITESGVNVQLKTLPISSYYNSIPKEVTARWMSDYQQGKMNSVPAIMIDGQIAYYGVPEVEKMKALLKAAEARKNREEPVRES